jgi:hypothetical protein
MPKPVAKLGEGLFLRQDGLHKGSPLRDNICVVP